MWNFDVPYEGHAFVGPTGATHVVSGAPYGEAWPGTHRVRLSYGQIKTKGGKVFGLGASAKLVGVRRGGQTGVWLTYTPSPIARARFSATQSGSTDASAMGRRTLHTRV